MKTELIYLATVKSMFLSLFLMTRYQLTPLAVLCLLRALATHFPTLSIQHPIYNSTSHNQRKELDTPYGNPH